MSKAQASFEAGAAEFDGLSSEGMELMEQGEYKEALAKFELALSVDEKTEGRQNISLERADVAYNISCCYAQLRELHRAEEWLRRAGMWGVKGVDPWNDDDLEPLRQVHKKEELLELVGITFSMEEEKAAVLGRARRANAGRQVMALAEEMSGDDEEESDGGEFEEASEAEAEARDVFDSDFDESEDESDDDDDNNERPHKIQKKNVTFLGKTERAAARSARAVNAIAVQGSEFNQHDSDDEDGDFQDAKADAEMKNYNRHHVAISAAAEAGARKRKVEAAYLDIFGKNDDGAGGTALAHFAAEASESQPKRPRLSEYQPGSYQLPTAFSVLSDIFGQVEAATIILKARKARRAREKEIPPTIDLNAIAAKALERRKTVVETRVFAGETIEIARPLFAPGKDQTDNKIAKIKIKKKPQQGIDAVLEELKGPKQVTAIEKSAHEWNSYKAKTGIEDSLRNASKEGFLENQDFLQRIDQRQFEHERDSREKRRLAAEKQAGNNGQT